MSARPLPSRFLVAFSFAGEQRELVREVAELVEKRLGRGTIFFDEWYVHYIAGAHAELRLQEIYGERSALVVVCVSGDYGAKPWTSTEHRAIRAREMKASASSDMLEQNSILPIRVGPGDMRGMLSNTIVPDLCTKSAEEIAGLILDRLHLTVPGLQTDEPAVAESSWPETPRTQRWSIADHAEVRDAFASLLTRGTPWRYLALFGASEAGKSHATRQMLENAVEIPGIACGRFDFKGTTGMDAELSSFVLGLGVSSPPVGSSLTQRLGIILDALKERAQPVLLIFDTYEAAGEAETWVEGRLLPSLVHASYLRVVIAGQRVPDRDGAIWASVARPAFQLVPPPARDWYNYAKQYRPNLTMEDVETAYRLACQRSSLLAQLLGPET